MVNDWCFYFSRNFEYTFNGKVEHCQSKIKHLTNQLLARVVLPKGSTADRHCSLQKVNVDYSFNRKKNIIRAKSNIYLEDQLWSADILSLSRNCHYEESAVCNFECSFSKKVENFQSKIKRLF